MTAATLAGVLRGAGTRIELSTAGDVRAIGHGDATLVSQYLATPHDAMVGGVFLRRRTTHGTIESAALVGGHADGTFAVYAPRWCDPVQYFRALLPAGRAGWRSSP